MSPATPREPDIARVHIWWRQRVPDGLHDELRIECDVEAGQATIYEARPPWQPGLGPEWIRSPVAQLRYAATSRAWTLYWPDRNLRWRQYRDVPAGRSVEELLDEIGRDPTGISGDDAIPLPHHRWYILPQGSPRPPTLKAGESRRLATKR